MYLQLSDLNVSNIFPLVASTFKNTIPTNTGLEIPPLRKLCVSCQFTKSRLVTENVPLFPPSPHPPTSRATLRSLSHFLAEEEQLFLRFRPSGQLSTPGAEASARRVLDSWEQLRVPGEPLPPQSQRSLHADRRNVAASPILVDAACAQMSLGNHSRHSHTPSGHLRCLSARAPAKNNRQLWILLFNQLDLQLCDALVVEFRRNDQVHTACCPVALVPTGTSAQCCSEGAPGETKGILKTRESVKTKTRPRL